MNYRHINRGHLREGGCPECKPARPRWDNRMVPIKFVYAEADTDVERSPDGRVRGWPYKPSDSPQRSATSSP